MRESRKILVDGVGLRDGGGATILQQLYKHLPLRRPSWQWRFAVLPPEKRGFSFPSASETSGVVECGQGAHAIGRVLWQNHGLPRHAEAWGADAVLCLANLGPTRCSIPVAIMLQQAHILQDFPTWSFLKRLYYRIQRVLFQRSGRAADSLIVQTEMMRSLLRQIDAPLADKARVIPSGCREIDASLQVRSNIKEMIARAPAPRIAYVSQFREHKNHVLLADVLEILPEGSLLLTAEQSTEPPFACVAEFCRRAEKKAVSHRVIWLGRLNDAEVDYLLQASDVFVFPSLAESFGLPLVEAMVAGCPIVAADLPYAREIAANSALYFDPKDAQGAARAIALVLSDAYLRTSLVENARREKARFQYPNVAEAICALLESSFD